MPPEKRMECFRLIFDHLAWIEPQFLSGIRNSRKAGSLWEMMRGVGGVRKSIHQDLLAKGSGLGLLCWGFNGVQVEIPREEASTLQSESVAFPAGQYTSPQLHPHHRLFDQDEHQDICHPPYIPDLAPCDIWLFPKFRGCRYETIEEMKEAVTKVIDTLFHNAANVSEESRTMTQFTHPKIWKQHSVQRRIHSGNSDMKISYSLRFILRTVQTIQRVGQIQ